MAKCKSALIEKRNQEMRDYYQELRRTGYMQKLALNLVREKFAVEHLSCQTLKRIVKTINVTKVVTK